MPENKTTGKRPKRKRATVRRKKTSTTNERSASADAETSEETIRGDAEPKAVHAEETVQTAVEDGTRNVRSTAGSAKRKTTRRRAKKKAFVAAAASDSEVEAPQEPVENTGATSRPLDPAEEETALMTAESSAAPPGGNTGRAASARSEEPSSLPVTEESSRRRTRRGRRGGKRQAVARTAEAEADALQKTAPDDSEETRDKPDDEAVPNQSEERRVPLDRRSAEAAPSSDEDRPRRARTRRGTRTANRRTTATPTASEPVAESADARDVAQLAPQSRADTPASFDRIDEPIDETEDTVEVGDVVFPKPDLSEPCKREMIINVTGSDECRIAILQDGRLEELFIERASAQSHVGNIYKGRITNVEPSIQAAFVDFGLPKNGFLHISDVQPQYFPTRTAEAEEVGRKIPRHHRPPIQKCFRRGQEVIVQIIKEGVGTKGPTLTTYLSIPGRYLVMMPGMNRHGVSRKIEDEEARRKMKDVMNELSFPSGMGFILRTAGLGQSKRELQRDLNYLVRLWKRVVDRIKRLPSPAELYRESDLVTRTIRDVYSTDFDRIIVDDPIAARKAKDFFQIAMPRSSPRIEVYTDPEPLFHVLGIEEEIERIHARHVPLKSGGSLVIDSTEALVAIDVNSGRYRALDDAEETALRINLEAAEEIARQLRLRDLGGLIVCDFIDMRLDRNKRAVERALRDALKKHKERARILRMSAFGLIEMTRQRQGPSLKRNIYFDCPHCRGSGLVKMPESVILDVMRTIQLAAHKPEVKNIRVTVSTEVAYQILNTKRSEISALERATGKNVIIRGDLNFTSDQVECVCEDDRGQPIVIAGPEGAAPTNRPSGVRRT